MSEVSIHVDRLQLTLHGVSAEVAETALAGLQAELHRRLVRLPPGELPLSGRAELVLGSIRVRGHIDAAALRGLIADRVVATLSEGVA